MLDCFSFKAVTDDDNVEFKKSPIGPINTNSSDTKLTVKGLHPRSQPAQLHQHHHTQRAGHCREEVEDTEEETSLVCLSVFVGMPLLMVVFVVAVMSLKILRV